MNMETTKEAAEVTGCLRYWSLDDTETIVDVASSPFPEERSGEPDKYAALSKAYWRHVRGEQSGLFSRLFGKRDPNVPETREGIVAKARADGFEGIWGILRPSFCGEEMIPIGVMPSPYAQVLLELGPIAVALAIRVFQQEAFSTQHAFHNLGMAFLRRAKLLIPFVVSLIGKDELPGERIALASVMAHRTVHPSVRALLKAVATLPEYAVAAKAGLAKLDEYPEGESDFGDFRFLPDEFPDDVICKNYEVPGGVERVEQ